MLKQKSLDLFLLLFLAFNLPLTPSIAQPSLLNYSGKAKILVKTDGPATFEEVIFTNGQASLNLKNYRGEIGWLYATDIDRNMVHYVVLEPGEITIKATPDSMIFISGTPNNDAFYQLDLAIEPLRIDMRRQQNRIKLLRDAGKPAEADSVQDIVFEIAEVWWAKQKAFAFEQDNLAGLNYAYKLLTRLTLDELSQLLKQYNHLSDKAIYQKMKARYDSESKTGKGMTAPDVRMESLSGDSLALHEITGKLIVVDFWASWCKPCRIEHPMLKQLYESWHDQGLEIISISVDNKNDREKWIHAVEEDGLTWIQLWDREGTARKLYGVSAVPRTFLINQKKEIVAKDLRGPALEKFISRYLGN